ncbi:MAG: ribonuclease HII [Clostridiales bacterium 43-6]|nr:MAG: ribonuclease HII [Clostridiales bacterium 43-6]
MPDYSFETEYRNQGFQSICGIDEAGRGPLAGPVCAAAVILPDGLYIEGLNDSKKLSEKKREALYDVITKEAVAYAVCYATVEEIDTINILQATFLAMTRAVEALAVKPDFALIDGNGIPKTMPVPAAAIIKGDALSMSIAAASILAKVSRDRLMKELDRKYPAYLLEKHKGYGTAVHMELIKKHGACAIHRRSFLKKIH